MVYRRIFMATLAAVAISACGEAEATEEIADAGGEDAAAETDTQASTAPDAQTAPTAMKSRASLTPIPAAFHGKWGMLGDCSQPMVITAGGIDSPGAQPLSSVKILDASTIELDREPNPEYPDADERFGLSVYSEDILIMHAPQMSSLRFERCGTGAPAEKQTASAGGGLPAKFRGRWDGGEFGDCSSGSPDAVTVEGWKISDNMGSGWRLTGLERVDANTYRTQANYYSGDYTGERFPMTVRLEDGGETLVLAFQDGSNVYEMRCD